MNDLIFDSTLTIYLSDLRKATGYSRQRLHQFATAGRIKCTKKNGRLVLTMGEAKRFLSEKYQNPDDFIENLKDAVVDRWLNSLRKRNGQVENKHVDSEVN